MSSMLKFLQQNAIWLGPLLVATIALLGFLWKRSNDKEQLALERHKLQQPANEAMVDFLAKMEDYFSSPLDTRDKKRFEDLKTLMECGKAVRKFGCVMDPEGYALLEQMLLKLDKEKEFLTILESGWENANVKEICRHNQELRRQHTMLRELTIQWHKGRQQ